MPAFTFHHIALTCASVARSEEFYCQNFGFVRKRAFAIGDGKEIIYIGNGQLYLELFAKDTDRPSAPPMKDGFTYPGVRHIAFRVDDVDAALAALHGTPDVSLGPISFDAFIPGWKSAWIRDPDENIVEISQGYRDA